MVLRHGEFIYAGSQKEALGYFSPFGFVPQPGENPADFYIEVAFGLAISTADPPVAAADLAAKWTERIAASRQDELDRLQTGECTQEAWVAWCKETMPAVGSDTRSELWLLVANIASLAGVDVTWELVYASVGTWPMVVRPLPGMWTQFTCCITRYIISLWRKRSKFLGTICIMCAPHTDSP